MARRSRQRRPQRPTRMVPSTACPGAQRSNIPLVAIGGPAPTPIGAGLTVAITYVIPEDGRIQRLTLQEQVTGDLFGLSVDSVEHNNQLLISGTVPAEIFSADATAVTNPNFDRLVKTNDNLVLTLTNTTAAGMSVISAFSV